MVILLHLGVAAPHQNYDVTSRTSKDAGFLKNFNTRVFSPKCTILPSYSKIGAGRGFLVQPSGDQLVAQLPQNVTQSSLSTFLFTIFS